MAQRRGNELIVSAAKTTENTHSPFAAETAIGIIIGRRSSDGNT